MRIWHQSFARLSELPVYRGRLGVHAGRVVTSATKVDIHGMPDNVPAPAERYPAVEYVMHKSVLDAVYDAERGGYDAVTLGCFNDPVLREARGLVDIPVLGLAETSILVSCFYGRKLGFVTMNRAESEAAKELVELYGLSARVAGYVALDVAYSERELEKLGDSWSELLLDEVQSAYCRCVEMGAEVVIPAEGVLSEYLVAARRDGILVAPLVDVMGVLWKQAETLVELGRTVGFGVSRERYYKKPVGVGEIELSKLFGSVGA